MEGHIVSLTNMPTFSNVKSGLNQCRREGTGKEKGQPGGNVCKDGQGKDSLIGIKRERIGRYRAGDITKDEEGYKHTRLLLSRASKRISELQTSLGCVENSYTTDKTDISLPLESKFRTLAIASVLF